MKGNKELKAALKEKAFNSIQQRLSVTPENLYEMFSLLLNNKMFLSGNRKKKYLGIIQLINYTKKKKSLAANRL